MLLQLRKDQRGFTLIELMTVVAIIAVLAGIGIPIYRNFITRAEQAQVLTATDPVRQALATYYAENGSFPYAAAAGNANLQTALNTYVSVDTILSGTDVTGIGITNTRVELALPAAKTSASVAQVDAKTVWTTGTLDGGDVKGYIIYGTAASADPTNYLLMLYTSDGTNTPETTGTARLKPFKCYDKTGDVTCQDLTA